MPNAIGKASVTRGQGLFRGAAKSTCSLSTPLSHAMLRCPPPLRSFGASGVRFGGEGFVEVLAATQTPTDKEWFQVRCIQRRS